MSERQYPRFAVELSVVVTPVGKAGFTAMTRDISLGGICFVAEKDHVVSQGTTVAIAMQLVFDEQTASEPLSLQARVIWCTPAEDRLQIGCKFQEVGSEAHDYLAMFLRFLRGDVDRNGNDDP